jgi:hypothetical protein
MKMKVLKKDKQKTTPKFNYIFFAREKTIVYSNFLTIYFGFSNKIY